MNNVDHMKQLIQIVESAEHLAEAPYLDKNYVPVDIDAIIDYYDDGKGMFVSQQYPVIDAIAIQKLTKGATPVVKLDMPTFGVGYYTFTSEDDKTVYVQMVRRDIGPGTTSEYRPQMLTKKKMPIEDFKKKYPDLPFDSWDDTDSKTSNWKGDDWILIADYYYRKEVEKTLVQMENGAIFELRDGLTKELLIAETGVHVANERKVKTTKIMYCKMSAKREADRNHILLNCNLAGGFS